MIKEYIILNRTSKSIINLFIIVSLFLIILVIYGINTFYYQSFFHIHSQISEINSYYYLEVSIPVKEVNYITNKNKIIIDGDEYCYKIHKIDTSVNQDNFIKIYLNVKDLDQKYKINGYQLEVKIEKEYKKIKEYF